MSKIEYEWTECKWREPTEEELLQNPDATSWADCKMPEDGQDILITVYDRHGNRTVQADICEKDSGTCCLDSGYDWEDVIAWAPFPKPFKEQGG